MKSFLLGKKCHDQSALRPSPGALSVPATSPIAARVEGAGTPGAPGAQVKVVKEGGKVVRLIVTCACGDTVEVECLYSPGT